MGWRWDISLAVSFLLLAPAKGVPISSARLRNSKHLISTLPPLLTLSFMSEEQYRRSCPESGQISALMLVHTELPKDWVSVSELWEGRRCRAGQAGDLWPGQQPILKADSSVLSWRVHDGLSNMFTPSPLSHNDFSKGFFVLSF